MLTSLDTLVQEDIRGSFKWLLGHLRAITMVKPWKKVKLYIKIIGQEQNFSKIWLWGGLEGTKSQKTKTKIYKQTNKTQPSTVVRKSKGPDRGVVTEERICRTVTHGVNDLKRLKSIGDEEASKNIHSGLWSGAHSCNFFWIFEVSFPKTHSEHCKIMLWFPFQLFTSWLQ